MVYPDTTQPTDRSGSAHPSQLHAASKTAASGNHELCAISSIVPGKGSPDALPLYTRRSPPSPLHDPSLQHESHPHHPLPSLHVRTDMQTSSQMSPPREADSSVRQSFSSSSLPRRTPSLRGLFVGAPVSGGSLSPASLMSSPQLMAMGDITPLPSPIGGASSWRLPRRNSQSLSRTPSTASRSGSSLGLRLSDSSQMFSACESRPRSKQYMISDTLSETPIESPTKPCQASGAKHARNRSLSEYVPPSRAIPVKPRPIAVSGTGAPSGITSSSSTDSSTNNLHREQYLAIHRGIALPTVRPPTPPRSNRSGFDESDNEPVITPSTGGPDEMYSVRSIRTQQRRKYRKLRQLGQGTFSQVSLAARVEMRDVEDYNHTSSLQDVTLTQKLVAVKIIEYGPAGGADEERLEVSLKREVDILKSVNHPSLVQLKAFGSDEKRALLVLDYCPGGDLFDVASSSPRPMSPEIIRRMFAELVAAVRYLHEHYIVHRDIKLESEYACLFP
ncbi:kinase-like protein [Aspergillus heteromorphus CBS 117.55]|uniref:Kinase-like protein n=1 Tax=Aspergillus heteromorphus CBS 117.55 TaxID=1448321 RepID=A0A317VJ47_9EURO|nr:kinase-like protein [Aspergillus heteromorphus CBS 117.55]PWY74356.1 kinase-like protein [Aspergillus heteromorphus CBS 117.55]